MSDDGALTLYVFVGLPGCGKSTRARKMLVEAAQAGRRLARMNRDLMRDSVSTRDTYKRPDTEDAVTLWQRAGIRALLGGGWSVVVDDTSFRPEFRAAYQQIAEACGARFELIDMTGVPLEVCVEQNNRREWRGYPPYRWDGAQVSEPIIREMHDRWIADGTWKQ
jgi:predicted kinase